LPSVLSTVRKLELLNAAIDAASGAADTTQSCEEWKQRAVSVLRSTLGSAHASVAAASEARFSPYVISLTMSDQDWRESRQHGVNEVVALLKGATIEVEAATEDEPVTRTIEARGKRIFVVHGHDGATKLEVTDFLHRLTGERQVILHEQADRGRTIIEKFEDHAEEAGFAVVILTGDDEGRAKGTKQFRSRARQNVVLELGFFIGHLGRDHVVALLEGGVEVPSDLHGVLYKELSGNWQMELVDELRAAGIATPGLDARPREARSRPRQANDDEEADPSGEPLAVLVAPVPPPALTSRWRHTTDGMDAAGAMNAIQKRLHHPTYSREPGTEPPAVRFGLLIACEPLGDEPSTTSLRKAFCAFLNRPPIWDLMTQLTATPMGATWSTFGGNGRLSLGSVMDSEGGEGPAPLSSAILNLHDGQATKFQQSRRAELVLYIEPCDENGALLPPATLERWYERLVTALQVPAALVTFLSDELGLATYADPPVQFGVCLEGRPNVGALVDTSGLQPVAGSTATSHFPSYFIAQADGLDPRRAAVEMLRVWCDYALHVEGYEDPLNSLA
jgi:predicted nucleotide-binding protein